MPLIRANELPANRSTSLASDATPVSGKRPPPFEANVYEVSPSTHTLSKTAWRETSADPILRCYHYLSSLRDVTEQDDPELAAILAKGDALLIKSKKRQPEVTPPARGLTQLQMGGGRKKQMLVSGLLMLGGIPGIMGTPVMGRGKDKPTETSLLPDDACDDRVDAVDISLSSQMSPTRMTMVDAAKAYWAYSRENSQTYKRNVKDELGHIFDQTTLPIAYRNDVVERVYREYGKFEQIINKRHEREILRHLDIILLDMGLESGPFQMCYRNMGQVVRRRLGCFVNFANVKQYIKENQPHAKNSVLDSYVQNNFAEYHNASVKYDIQREDFFRSNSTMLDSLITKVYCEHFATPDNNPCSLSLTMKHEVEFIWRYLILIFSPYVTESFTTKELFLGVYKRVALEKGNVDINFPQGTDRSVLLALDPRPNITDYIDDELRALFLTLQQDSKTRALFESAVLFRARGIIINSLDILPGRGLSKTIRRFLNNDLKPLLVTLQGHPIPNLLALSSPMDSEFFLISLAYSDVKVFSKNKWNADLKEFVTKHLSLFDRTRVATGDIKIGKLCSMGMSFKKKPEIGCYDVDLGYAYSDNYARDMYDAILRVIEMNINSITYTHKEYTEENHLFILRRTLFMASILTGVLSAGSIAPYWAALMVTMGLGIGIGEVYVNQMIVENTDDGAIYEKALLEAKLGEWSMVTSVVDFTLGQTVLLNQFKSSAKILHPMNNQISATSPKISARLKELIVPGMYDKKVDVSLLSVPDAKGLQWSVDNLSYLKVNNNYIRVVKDVDREVYHIGETSITAIFGTDGSLVPLNTITRGGLLSKGQRYLYKDSPDFRVVNVPVKKGGDNVGYRTLGDDHYALFYTRSNGIKQQGSDTLVLSAHGGYYPRDLNEPAVLLPEEMTVKLLTPHDTSLNDPGLNNMVNVKGEFKTYLSISQRESTVNFVPQAHKLWKFGKDYKPFNRLNVFGREHGLQNYRHIHFENESPELIANVVLNNRKLAAKGEATLTDVMVVNNKILYMPDSDIELASIQRVIDLDREGVLRNAAGDPYNTIVFAHCRSNFAINDNDVSLYMATYPVLPGLPRGGINIPITKTILSRHHANEPFSIKEEDIGEMTFFPVVNISAVNATMSS